MGEKAHGTAPDTDDATPEEGHTGAVEGRLEKRSVSTRTRRPLMDAHAINRAPYAYAGQHAYT